MGSDSAQHLVKRAQRRFLRIVVAIGVVIVLVATPLILSGSLRLELAWRLGLAPGENVEQIAGGNSGKLLVVIPVTTDLTSDRIETRFHAAYLMQPVAGGTQFTSLDNDATFTVPLTTITLISADPAGEHLLLSQQESLSVTRFLVTVGNNSFEQLPAGQQEPSIPGTWKQSIWNTRVGQCEGISPTQTYIACFEPPSFARYLAGDWQLDVRRYGQFKDRHEIYRGAGTKPLVGFTRDDAWIYFQNENGIWREPLSLDMFAMA